MFAPYCYLIPICIAHLYSQKSSGVLCLNLLLLLYITRIESVCLLLTSFGLLLLVFDEHVRRGKIGGGNAREMDFESFLDFVLALENKDAPEGLTYLFRCLDLQGRGFLTTADIHTLFR